VTGPGRTIRTPRASDVTQAPGSLPRHPALALFHTLPGRLFLLSGALFFVLRLVQVFVDLPEILDLFRRVVALALIVSAIWLLALGWTRHRHHFLWRVRRKLILSYLLLGLVPVALVAALGLAAGIVLYINVTSYLFRESFHDVEQVVQQAAEAAATQMGASPDAADEVLERVYLSLTHPQIAPRYFQLSLTAVPAGGTGAPRTGASAGPWQHLRPPSSLPDWVLRAGHTTSVLAYDTATRPGEPILVIRAAAATPDGTRIVIADLPVEDTLKTHLADRTGIEMGTVAVTAGDPRLVRMLRGADLPAPPLVDGRAGSAPTGSTLFRRNVVPLPVVADWETGLEGTATIGLEAPATRVFGRLTVAQSTFWQYLLLLPVVLGGLFVIVQGAALVFGISLGRSITSAVHELFMGTERIGQGDFAHRISIESRDQLGDLASSFNRMSASIEHLLHVQREKQRLDDELRIAREIQKSLLPVEPPKIDGLAVADLCEPAREVGGDYYDFFEIGPRQLGVLVADVSGKGTSAALYMAELKGLMLALSHSERSPRRLLADVNRRLVNQLDNRSFITMTYAVLDLDAGTLTCARAGHTPLLVVSNGRSQIVTPDGMVLGLRLPGATDRFEQILQEHVHPIVPGDVIVLYTDGITEAMDEEGELFGDEGLARVVCSHTHLEPAGIRERVVREVRAFAGRAEPHDDMTMIVLKIRATESDSAAA
jgi:sigma-B regulation protein RsbU (phosphoserine phosphatase)